jgi:copper(I)-binding protein
MKYIQQFFFFVLFCLFLFKGCSPESKQKEKQEIILGKIELVDGWARPGSQGQTSGAYLTITNGTASVDTLVQVSSNVAKKTELHKSIKNEDGTMSMQPAGNQIIEDGSKLQLQPGGLHIMLINLKRDLGIGDSLDISLEFSRVGTKTITVPVQIQH